MRCSIREAYDARRDDGTWRRGVRTDININPKPKQQAAGPGQSEENRRPDQATTDGLDTFTG